MNHHSKAKKKINLIKTLIENMLFEMKRKSKTPMEIKWCLKIDYQTWSEFCTQMWRLNATEFVQFFFFSLKTYAQAVQAMGQQTVLNFICQFGDEKDAKKSTKQQISIGNLFEIKIYFVLFCMFHCETCFNWNSIFCFQCHVNRSQCTIRDLHSNWSMRFD